MPKLLQETQVSIRWTDVNRRQPKFKMSPETRSSGVHLSGIIRHCLYGDRKDADPDAAPINMCHGLAWEAFAVTLFPEIYWQSGEEETEGVFGTADGLSSLKIGDEYEIVIEEFKCTWKSKRTHGDILKETAWIWQCAALCHMHGLVHARLHVMFVNGDYRPPQPVYMTYLIEFSKPELELFWANVIIRNKDKAIPEEGTK